MVPTSWRRRLPGALPGLLLTACLGAQAQSAASAARPDPLDPRATVPASAYVSSLTHFRRLGDVKAMPWREANDTVTRIGGWRAYAREAQQPEAPPPAPATTPAEPVKPTPLPAATPPGHAGHKMP